MTYLSDEQIGQLLKRTEIISAAGCVLWTGCTNREGYGVIKIGGRDGRTFLTHRLTYAVYVGPLITGLQIDHLCRVRRCLAPSHLEQVTAKVNSHPSRSGAAAARTAHAAEITHCPHGHPYDESNTYRPPGAKYAHRMCRECGRRRWRAWAAQKGQRVAT